MVLALSLIFPAARSNLDRPGPALNSFLRLPYEVAGTLAAALGRIVPAGGGKLRRSLAGRRGVTDRFRRWAATERAPQRPLIWMHAPSVGEGLMAKPVLELLRAAHPDLQLAYTWYSPSAEAFAASLDVDVRDYLPFDTSAAARAMLDALQPSAIVFSKLDVWPLLTEAAAARGIPVALTSAALAASSTRRAPVARWLLHDAYAALAAVGAVSAEDAGRLVGLGVAADRISITGDTRYDQVWARVRAPATAASLFARLSTPRPTLVAGSTWPADEQVLFEAWATVKRSVPDARMIIAPHEPDPTHVAGVRARAASLGVSASLLGDAAAESDIIIVDRMGVLADLYALATVAYVGGGFHGAGLHSVVEPAAHGVPVLFGPAHGASRDASALVAAGGGFATRDAGEMADRIIQLMSVPTTRDAAGRHARSVVESELGAAERTATLVAGLIDR